MYLDHPNFPHRKVVHNSNQSLIPCLGSQRLQLSNYVVDQLNNNNEDNAAILQKFRNNAKEYKKNLLHRGHHQFNKQLSHKMIQDKKHQTNKQIKLSSTPVINHSLNILNQFSSNQSQSQQQLINIKYTNKLYQKLKKSQNKYQQLVKLFKKKDKECYKKQQIIIKNLKKINQLKKRVQIFQQRQKLRLSEIQQNSYHRIKEYISSIQNKLQQNKSFIMQKLMTKSQVSVNKYQNYAKKKQWGIASQISIQPKKRKKINPQLLNAHQRSPQMHYTQKLKSEGQLKQFSNRIKHSFINLQSNRN